MTSQYEIDLRRAISSLEAIRVGKPACISDIELELKAELRGYLMANQEELKKYDDRRATWFQGGTGMGK